jgi:hypothetical protein
MKLGEITEILNKALAKYGPDTEFALCWEEGAMTEGYSETFLDGITDVRFISDWPLPGTSLVVYEGQPPGKVVAFYGNLDKLDSSTEVQ